MPLWRHSGFGTSLLAFLMGTTAAGTAYSQSAGTVGAANVDATSQVPGGAARTVTVGSSVSANEQFTTGPNGTVHVTFKDRSALNVGRNSSVSVDSFNYNETAGTGNMAVSVARGVARYVGGQISHSSGATVKTPAASIGVRGGIVTVAQAGATTTVMLHTGGATVTTNAGQVTLYPGQQISVTSNGPIPPPQPIDPALLRVYTQQLTSQGTQTGGAIRQPTDTDASRNQIGNARPTGQTPNFDLPGVGDDLVRDRARTIFQPYP